MKWIFKYLLDMRSAALTVSAIILPMSMAGTISQAQAASCWGHNGSLMRLEESGNQRWLYYDNPKSSLHPIGVGTGTLLFDGRKNGNWYSGTARRFSKYCKGTPLEYYVEGPVLQNPLRLVLRGTRQVHRQCRDTGRVANDELVFTYSHRC